MENKDLVLLEEVNEKRVGLVEVKDRLIDFKSKLLDAEIAWAKKMQDCEEYQELMELKNIVSSLEEQEAEKEKEVINLMLEKNVKKIEAGKLILALKNTGRPSVIIEDESLVPEEYTRTKKEIDKKAILEAYKTSGILIQGTDIKDEPNYKLNIKLK